MTDTTETRPTARDAEPSVLIVDPSPKILRGYDFNQGDERFFDRDEAIAKARLRVKDRGCRQQVRPVDVHPDDARLHPRWLVQDI